MRKRYSEYYHPTEEELKQASSDAWFVFDTNALLDVLRLSPALSSKTIECIRSLQSKIKIPANVDYEYHRHMVEIPAEMIGIVETAIKKMKYETFEEQFKAVFPGGKTMQFPKDCIKEYTKEFTLTIDSIKSRLESLRDHYLNLFRHQNHQMTLSSLLEGCLLPEFSQQDIEKIEQEGVERYDHQIPPGYKDKDKEDNKYGDLIIWKEMIELAKTSKKHIFFVTNDSKEDWIYKPSGKTWGPRVELIREFSRETGGQLFHIYTLTQFLEIYGKGFGSEELQIISDQQPNHAIADIEELQTLLKQPTQHRAVGSITILRAKPKVENDITESKISADSKMMDNDEDNSEDEFSEE